MHNKKNLIALIMLLVIGSNQPLKAESNVNVLGVFGWLLGSGAIVWAGKKVADSDAAKTFSSSSNSSVKDVSNVLGLSTACMSLAALVDNKEKKEALTRFAWRSPIIAMTTLGSNSRWFKEVIKEVPFVGQYLGCSNQDCPGSCNECKLTSSIVHVGTYLGASQLIDKYFPKLTRVFNKEKP